MNDILNLLLKGESDTVEFKKSTGYGFDYQPEKKATLADIDPDSVYQFLEIANTVRDFNQNILLPVEIILQNLELMKDTRLTRAALLLFGKSPQKFFPNHYEIKCGHFFSDEGYDEISNDKEFNRNLLENFHLSLGFIKDSIKKRAVKVKNSIQRVEEWEFSLEVMREALVNMIVHRDYRQGIKSTLEIRPSSISFYNPGQLFAPTITIERLKRIHPSRPGNRLIAKIFYLMGVFENWGGGTLKIISETIKAGKPAPGFFYQDGMFRLEFYRR